jgi:hypothetical protein
MGVHIMDKAMVVLKRFGNPTKIITSGGDTSGNTGGAAGGPGAAAPVSPGAPGASPSEFTPGAGSTPSTGSAAPDEVTYQYALRPGLSCSFILSSDGRVIQISVVGSLGQHAETARTSRGITLGSAYSDVITKYGFPEHQAAQGATLTALYTEHAHCAFQFQNNRVIGITVAEVE